VAIPRTRSAAWRTGRTSSRRATPRRERSREDYRNYDNPARDTVCDFYRLNHRHQTYDFVRDKNREFFRLDRRRMTVLEALDFLETLVDDSDPDISLSQREHLLQSAEAIRAGGHEDWFVLVGLIHDLGKVLCLFGEPQWAVVGDTFPVGCAFSDRIVYPEFFADNPDSRDPRLQGSKRGLPARVTEVQTGL
jgi:inositol oxygenase